MNMLASILLLTNKNVLLSNGFSKNAFMQPSLNTISVVLTLLGSFQQIGNRII